MSRALCRKFGVYQTEGRSQAGAWLETARLQLMRGVRRHAVPMITLADARRIAEGQLGFRPDDDELLPTHFGWLFGGGLDSVMRGRFDSRTGIGSPFVIIERDTGAAFLVPSAYSLSLTQVLTAFGAGFRRPSYDLTITNVQDEKTTTQCLPVAVGALRDLPATIRGLEVWLDFSPIAHINTTGCCLYYAQPCERLLNEGSIWARRDELFHVTVVAVHSIDGAVKFLADILPTASALQGALVSRPREAMTTEHIRIALATVPTRFLVRGEHRDVILALNSNTVFSCTLERAGEVDL